MGCNKPFRGTVGHTDAYLKNSLSQHAWSNDDKRSCEQSKTWCEINHSKHHYRLFWSTLTGTEIFWHVRPWNIRRAINDRYSLGRAASTGCTVDRGQTQDPGHWQGLTHGRHLRRQLQSPDLGQTQTWQAERLGPPRDGCSWGTIN